MLRKETDPDAIFSTEAHQEGTAGNIAEETHAADRMHGQPQADFFFHLDDNCLSLLGKVGALCRNEKSIEVFFHDSPSIAVRWALHRP